MRGEPLAVLYQDDWLLVALKPSGLLSQPGRGPDLQDSLITRMCSLEPGLQLVHRLDRDTSGLILLARGQDSLRRLGELFSRRLVSKLYEAEVEGCLEGSGRIQNRLARLQRNPPRYGSHPDGRPALTLWRTRSVLQTSTQLWMRPITGRSHQLRVHLSELGHPILGDPIYGLNSVPPLRLHARALSLPHPFTGQRLRVCSPGADWISENPSSG